MAQIVQFDARNSVNSRNDKNLLCNHLMKAFTCCSQWANFWPAFERF
jgi:hypothetical protein